jgi:hypothetical protein
MGSSLAQTTWKLVVTSLQADGDAREAVVGADNWLSALRLARKQLGEDGGVPPGASCVMSANGEVTILDAAQRRRYLLTRSGSSASIQPVAAAPAAPATAAAAPPPAAPAASSATAAAPASTGKAAAPVRKGTLAYSPEESASVRAQLLAAAPAKAAEPIPATAVKAPEQVASAAAAAPAPQTTRKSNTVAYSPSETAAVRAQVAAAANGPTAVASAASPVSGAAAIGARSPSGAQPPVQGAQADKLGPGALRKGTLEYAPEDAAAARAQLLAARQAAALAETDPPPAGFSVGGPAIPRAPLSPAVTPASIVAAPASTTSGPAASARGAHPAADSAATAPASAPAGKAPRKSTMAYSPEESANIRAQLLAAQPGATPVAAPAPQPSVPAQPAAPVPVASAPAASPMAAPAVAAAAPRKSTMAYSPEESANIRAQLLAAQQAQAAPAAAPAASVQRRSSTVAYVESPFVGGALLALGSRSEEPTPQSPLTYRERTYFAHEQVDRARIEPLLRAELEKITIELAGRARGQFVSLAVFDHAFEGKPERPPIATLQWKDWRGAPVFWQGNQHSAPPMFASDEPVRTSFMPGPGSSAALAPVGVPVQVLSGPDARPAPVSPLYTPQARRPNDGREGTGEQDRRLALAFEAVQDLYFLGTVAEGLDFAVKLLSELVPSEAVAGFIYDINTDEFRCVAATGPGGDERRAVAIPSNVGLLAAAMHSGQDSFMVANAFGDPRMDPGVDGRVGVVTDNLAYLPLHKGEVWLGVLQLINREGQPKFSDGDLAVAGYLASQVLEFLQARRTVAPRRR